MKWPVPSPAGAVMANAAERTAHGGWLVLLMALRLRTLSSAHSPMGAAMAKRMANQALVSASESV
jgi:hypothetical protein